MSTLHWVDGGFDTGWTDLNTAFEDIVLDIPAGGVLKKFLVANSAVRGVINGNGVFNGNVVVMEYRATINGGSLAGRRLFSSIRRIPVNIVGFSDTIDLVRPYTSWYCAGDNELGFIQECSYANPLGTDWSIKLQSFTSSQLPGYATNVIGSVIVGFRALYSLP